MYFIYGTENYLISNEEKRIIAKFGIEPIIFDETSSLDYIINEIVTISMFNSKKVIVIRNHDVFKKEHLSSRMLKTISKIDNFTELIFVYNEGKPKISNPLIRELMNNSISRQFDHVPSKLLFKVITDMVKSKNGQITSKASIMLGNKLPNDLRIISAEIDKLLLENNEITDDMVKKSISKYTSSDDYFGLTNAIISRDATTIFSTYKERLVAGDDINLLINQISSSLILANTIKNYAKQGISSKEIAEEIGVHLFRIKKAKELSIKINDKELRSLIIKLSELDENIKKGKINPKIGLERFLLYFVK